MIDKFTFTETNCGNVHSLCLVMLDAGLSTVQAFEMLKVALHNDYELDMVELELYRVAMDFRNGLNRNAEQWALDLRAAWYKG